MLYSQPFQNGKILNRQAEPTRGGQVRTTAQSSNFIYEGTKSIYRDDGPDYTNKMNKEHN